MGQMARGRVASGVLRSSGAKRKLTGAAARVGSQAMGDAGRSENGRLRSLAAAVVLDVLLEPLPFKRRSPMSAAERRVRRDILAGKTAQEIAASGLPQERIVDLAVRNIRRSLTS